MPENEDVPKEHKSLIYLDSSGPELVYIPKGAQVIPNVLIEGMRALIREEVRQYLADEIRRIDLHVETTR